MKIFSFRFIQHAIRHAALTSVLLASAVLPMQANGAAPVVTPLGAHSTFLQAPARVAVDSAGNLYVTEPAAGKVVIFDAFGRVVSTKQGFAGPLAIALDGTDRIYLSEEKTGSVSVFDSNFGFLYKLGAGDGEFLLPAHLALDSSNTVYVADSRANVIKVYAGSTLVNQFGTLGDGPGQLDFPAGVAVSANGEVFVVDQNNDRLEVFTQGGAFLRQYKFGGMLGPSGRKQAALLDNSGRLYLCDSYQGIVKVFDAASGAYLSTIGSFGEGAGQFRLPTGLGLDCYNRLRTASLNNGRVETFGLDSFIHCAVSSSSQIVGTGENVVFSVVVGGAGPATYQWRKDGQDLSGGTNAILSLNGLAPGDAGSYSVVVTSPTGVVTSPEAALAIMTPPQIVAAPISQVVPQGTNVLLNVEAAGDALAYQWQKNGQLLPGGRNASLVLADVQPRDAGDYSVTISNAVGLVTSPAAALRVLLPPLIVNQPLSQTLFTGDAALFEVMAQGDLLSYQWFCNGSAIPGANASTFQLNSVQSSSSGAYSVVITNPVGAVMSEVALLAVSTMPSLPRITGMNLLPDNQVQIIGLVDPGFNFAIEASTNLLDWEVVTNTASATGFIQIVDPNSGASAQRFYRLKWAP